MSIDKTLFLQEEFNDTPVSYEISCHMQFCKITICNQAKDIMDYWQEGIIPQTSEIMVQYNKIGGISFGAARACVCIYMFVQIKETMKDIHLLCS